MSREDDEDDYYYDENDAEYEENDEVGGVGISTVEDAYSVVYGPHHDTGLAVDRQDDDVVVDEDEEEDDAAYVLPVADEGAPDDEQRGAACATFSETEADPLHSTYYQPIATYANKIENCKIADSSSRITSDYITKYELAQVLAQRVKEIEASGEHYLVTAEEAVPTHVEEIALLEIKTRRCPLSILRRLESNVYEKWDVNELNLPPDV